MAWVYIGILAIVQVLDIWLYAKVIKDRHCEYFQVWTGSGFYLAWKYKH